MLCICLSIVLPSDVCTCRGPICLASCPMWAAHDTAFRAYAVWLRLDWCCMLGMLFTSLIGFVNVSMVLVWFVVGIMLVCACA